MFDKLDANADGVVSCDEFLGYMVDKNTRMMKTEEVRSVCAARERLLWLTAGGTGTRAGFLPGADAAVVHRHVGVRPDRQNHFHPVEKTDRNGHWMQEREPARWFSSMALQPHLR